MGQQSVYSFLKRHRKKKYSTSQIAKYLKISSGSVATSCKKLTNQKIIKSERANKKHYKLFKYWI